MADIEVEETMVVSDVSEGSSSGEDSGVAGGLFPEPIRGVRNGRLPPFVTKLYDLVSNKAIDSTISWVSKVENQVSSGASSFVIWNEVDFVNNVLPLMSKSNIFDSFITQLNNYGFKKVSWDRREYANKWFQEGKPHMLKHIKRRDNRDKQTASVKDKLTSEIKKLKSEHKEVDNELHAFKAYVDNTISNQQKLLRSIANVIKSTFDHHHETNDNATQSLAMVGQQGHQTSELCGSSFFQSSVVDLTEEEKTT